MFQLLVNPAFDFMSKRKVAMVVSIVLVLSSVAVVLVHGINQGIEFKGGTELQIKYREAPDVGAIRSALAQTGIENRQVTTIGDPAENEIYIRIGLTAEGEEEKRDLVERVLSSLRDEQVKLQEEAGIVDLNRIDSDQLSRQIGTFPGLSFEEADALAASILERRKDVAIFESHEQLADVPGMVPEVLDLLEKRTFLGPFALRSQSYIGPAIGREIMQKAMWAIAGSLAGMLLYIWIRFQFQWGLAAVVALSHDTLITLGLFSVFNKEMSLPVVAAFLTLIGYSVNDTVVVFDRIRENLRIKGATQDLASLINLSINQTLSRTVITSGVTWIVVLGLFLFGGAALNAFAFVLVVGILVGTYSSIYIASPILVLWQRLGLGRGSFRARSRSGQRRAKKVRAS